MPQVLSVYAAHVKASSEFRREFTPSRIRTPHLKAAPDKTVQRPSWVKNSISSVDAWLLAHDRKTEEWRSKGQLKRTPCRKDGSRRAKSAMVCRATAESGTEGRRPHNLCRTNKWIAVSRPWFHTSSKPESPLRGDSGIPQVQTPETRPSGTMLPGGGLGLMRRAWTWALVADNACSLTSRSNLRA